MKLSRILLPAFLIAFLVAPTSMAWASEGSAGREARAASWAEGEVQELLRSNPGAYRLSATAVRLEAGVTVAVRAGALWPSFCIDNFLCLFEKAGFGGYEVSLSGACRVVNLGDYSYSGGRFNDKLSSLDNMQSSGQARFYNYKGSGDWRNLNNSNLVIVANGGTYRRDLSQDTSFDGGNANDKIDIVKTC